MYLINDPRDKNVIVTIEGLLSLRGNWVNGYFCNESDDDNGIIYNVSNTQISTTLHSVENVIMDKNEYSKLTDS